LRTIVTCLVGIVCYASASVAVQAWPVAVPYPGNTSVALARQSEPVRLSVRPPYHQSSPSFRVVYKFNGGIDGEAPTGPVLAVNGLLFGTTQYGGQYKYSGYGTLFSLSIAGSEHVLHRFSGGGADGNINYGTQLADINGELYFTTSGGGHGGSVLETNSVSGTEKTLYAFQGRPDADFPSGDLLQSGNTLYGTSVTGGYYGYGTIFQVNTSGAERVLYSFKDGTDGASPSSLIQLNGNFFGITPAGGSYFAGTLFKLSPPAVETTLYTFKGTTDGGDPSALIAYNGNLYGTTVWGGAYGYGTVFATTISGTHVIHNFNGADGIRPLGLFQYQGMLYGTTYYGGAYGYGTVFALTTSGEESVLHSFTGGTDGANPAASLTAFNGELYGTTANGGSPYCFESLLSESFGPGCGTVFSITP